MTSQYATSRKWVLHVNGSPTRSSIGENLKKKVILFFSNYLPLQILTLKICNHDISKSITARSFKLGQLIEDDEEIN